MSLDDDYRIAVEREAHRLKIAAGWAEVNRSKAAKLFWRGRADRLEGKPCASSEGPYLNGYYSPPTIFRRQT